MFRITLAAVLWGTTGVAVTYLGDLLAPTTVGFYRLLVSAAALLTLALVVRRAGALIGIARQAPVRVLLAGLGLGGYQALYFVAVATAGVSVATVVSLGVAPIVTSVWEAIQARTRPAAVTVTTIAAAIAGLLLISAAAPAEAGPRPLPGLLAAIGSGVIYAVSTLISRDLSGRTDALTLTTAMSIVGAVALAPIAYAEGLAFPVRAGTVGVLVYTGVITTAAAYALFYAGLRTVPGSVAAVLTLLEPLTAALLAVGLLGEPLPALTVAGGALLLGAVVALYLRPRAYQAVSVLS